MMPKKLKMSQMRKPQLWMMMKLPKMLMKRKKLRMMHCCCRIRP